MSLPAALLTAVERHPCFSGSYRSDSEILACVDPGRPLEPVVSAGCADCLLFHPGALATLLPLGMSAFALANALSAHVRGLRGYAWALGGYHTVGSGFWLSAAYYGRGLFLVDASRNRSARTDVEVLAEAFRLGVVQPEDPRMVDPALYTSELAYVNMATPISPVQCKQDLLTSPQRSATPRQGFHRVSIVEFQPLVAALAPAPVQASAPAPAHAQTGPAHAQTAPAHAQTAPAGLQASSRPSTQRPQAPPRPLQRGDVCPTCGAEVKDRPLFTGSFVGCLC